MTVEVTVLSPVQTEPISLQEAKDYCRIDFTDSGNDGVVSNLITEARQYAEELLGRSLATCTRQAIIALDPIPGGPLAGPVEGPSDSWLLQERPDIPLFGTWSLLLPIPYGPVQSITTVEYQLTRYDDPEWTTLAPTDVNGKSTYRLDAVADPPQIAFFTIVAATRWRLTYQAGYTAMPSGIRRALKALIAFWYDNREGDPVPEGIMNQFIGKRVFSLG